MKNKVYELKNKRKEYLETAQAAHAARNKAEFEAAMEAVKNLNAEIAEAEALQAEAGRFDETNTGMVTLSAAQQQRKAEDAMLSKVDAIRSGNEYVQAFAHAIRRGVTMENGLADEKLKPLYAALTEGGGTPEGSDGGFLVPIDFDNMIHEQKRELSPLSGTFTQEHVNTLTGWRAMDKAPTAGFTLVDEMNNVPLDDQPKFSKIEYKLNMYGLIVPVSRELLEDNTVGLLRYLARWFGRKDTITENKLLLALLAKLALGTVVEGSEVKAIKNALNVTLDPAISLNSSVLTNQSGFSQLDKLEDLNGNPLMQPDITKPTEYKLLGRKVIVVPDRFLPNQAGGTVAPLYLGDPKQYGTLFRRKAFEIASTNIGGESWRNASTEVRGLTRLDARVMDGETVTALGLPIDN